MTHFDEYNRIIENRKQNPLPEGQYGENHHVVPKSICPLLEKSKQNIVRLTAQEHFMAHYHLWLAFRDELKEKKWAKSMCYALHRMKQQLLKCDDVESMSKLYEEARIEFSKLNTGKDNPMSGKHFKRSAETCRKISEGKMGSKNPMYGKKKTEDARRKQYQALMGHAGYWTGKKQPKEAIAKRVAKVRGQKRTLETRKKISSSLQGLRWFTNGETNSYSRKCPEGFWAGMTRNKKKRKHTND